MSKLRLLIVPVLIFLFVLGGVLAVALSTEGSAVDGMLPCQFFGEVTVDGANVPDGTQIKATIDGAVIEWTTTTFTSVGKSVYTDLQIPVDTGPPKNGGVEGDTVHFFVGPTEIQGPDSTWTEVTGYLVLHHLHVSTAPPEYNLTMAVVGNGTVSPSSGDYPEGDMTITATPESGWQFDGWSTGDMSEIDDPAAASTTLTLDKDKTVTATFSEIPAVTHSLTMAVVGNGTVTPVSGDYPEGDMTITATPESGWQFEGWSTADMSEIDDPAAASTTLMLDKDKTVTATFSEITYSLTMAVVGNGTVTPGTGVYAEGDMAITATPDSGWQFEGWSTADMSEIDDPSAASTTLMLDKDKTVTATFSLIGEGQMLYEGWNLVTFNGETQPVGDAVSSLVDEGALVIMWYFHNDTKDWDMYSPTVDSYVNDLATVETLMPYWINVDRDILWTY